MTHKLTFGSGAGSAVAAIGSWKAATRVGDGRRAFAEMSVKFPDLSGLMVLDILNDRVELANGDGGAVLCEWSGPLSFFEDYRHDWKPLFFRVKSPKLDWLEMMLNKEMQIDTRRVTQPGREEQRLDVPVENHTEAAQVNFYIVDGHLIRDVADDDPMFSAIGGAAWNLDNVTHHRDVVRESAKEETGRQEAPVEGGSEG